MTGKENPQKPKPGLPEAIHPEIGNGALWTDDPHEFILRAPDPTSILDFQLLDPEERDAIILSWHDPSSLDSPTREEPPISETEATPVKPKRRDKKISLSTPERDPIPDWLVTGDKLILEEDPNKPVDIPQIEPTPEPHEDADATFSEEVEVEGKRVKKAIKKAKKAAKKKEAEKVTELPNRPDLGLSPFTSWLKSLRGSEYIHPYEDDFGLEQLNSTTREGISETFADLLAAQGYKDQAIDMYQLLMAKYPEKSSFFAAKIEALK